MKPPLVRVICPVHKARTVGRVVEAPDGVTYLSWHPASESRAIMRGEYTKDTWEEFRMSYSTNPPRWPKIIGTPRQRGGPRLRELGQDIVIRLDEIPEPWDWDDYPSLLLTWCPDCRIVGWVSADILRLLARGRSTSRRSAVIASNQ